MELQIDHVTKRYGSFTAVDDLSLTLTEGVWGLLGANGAEKTTLIRMLAGLLPPTAGEIRWNGVPIAAMGEAYREIFGYLPQEFGFFPEFTVSDYLAYVAALKGIPNSRETISTLLDKLSLTQVAKKRISKLSGGMKRRVGIAQALLNDPKILVLDEPTSGLDPGERVRFRNLLSEFARERIVVISTHIVSDVEYIASKNAIMKAGQLLCRGTTGELVSQVAGKVWQAQVPAGALPEVPVVSLRNEDTGAVSIRYLAENPVVPGSQPCPPRLEDLYLWLFPQERQ